MLIDRDGLSAIMKGNLSNLEGLQLIAWDPEQVRVFQRVLTQSNCTYSYLPDTVDGTQCLLYTINGSTEDLQKILMDLWTLNEEDRALALGSRWICPARLDVDEDD